MINDSTPQTILAVIAAFIVFWLLHQLLMGLYEKPAAKRTSSTRVNAKTKRTRSAAVSADDLTRIEGVGPKIASLLSEAGYKSFADISNASPKDLKVVLDDAGSRFRMHETKSWPRQATLANNGQWDELEAMQDELKAGR